LSASADRRCPEVGVWSVHVDRGDLDDVVAGKPGGTGVLLEGLRVDSFVEADAAEAAVRLGEQVAADLAELVGAAYCFGVRAGVGCLELFGALSAAA
jgi:hypothetical protein